MIQNERVHQLKMIKRPGCIYWSQADYKSLAWCCSKKGKCNFKVHWEQCFYRRGQLLKPFYKIPCMGDSSSDTYHLMQIIHIKKNKWNELIPENMWNHVPMMTRKTKIANVIKGVMRRKLSCLAQQNKGNVAWLFFRNTFLEIHG